MDLVRSEIFWYWGFYWFLFKFFNIHSRCTFLLGNQSQHKKHQHCQPTLFQSQKQRHLKRIFSLRFWILLRSLSFPVSRNVRSLFLSSLRLLQLPQYYISASCIRIWIRSKVFRLWVWCGSHCHSAEIHIGQNLYHSMSLSGWSIETGIAYCTPQTYSMSTRPALEDQARKNSGERRWKCPCIGRILISRTPRV